MSSLTHRNRISNELPPSELPQNQLYGIVIVSNDGSIEYRPDVYRGIEMSATVEARQRLAVADKPVVFRIDRADLLEFLKRAHAKTW